MYNLLKNKYNSFNACLDKVKFNFGLENTGYVPQGVCSLNNLVIVACYDGRGENNSLLLVFDNNNKKTIYLDSKIHCGGICYHKKTDSLFITGKGKGEKAFINRYCGKKVVDGIDKSTIVVDKIICVDDDGELYSTAAKHSSVAFINCYENNLFLGNFINYKSNRTGLIKRYRILSNGDLSVTVKRFDNYLSDTQGLCVYKYRGVEYYIFSRSFGRNRNSILNVCKVTDSNFINVSTLVMPCMAQQINFINDKLAVIFESCADKYRNTAISVNDGVYLLDFSKVLKCRDTFKDFCKGDKLFIDNKGIKMC